MDLQLPVKLSAKYTNDSQKARGMTETWVGE